MFLEIFLQGVGSEGVQDLLCWNDQMQIENTTGSASRPEFYLPDAKRFSISGQFTIFHHAAM